MRPALNLIVIVTLALTSALTVGSSEGISPVVTDFVVSASVV